MEMVVLIMLFIASVSAKYTKYGKHVYVTEHREWPDAQQYCRFHYTDLSPMTRPWVEERLKIAMEYQSEKFWIGLYKDDTQWKWSGGGNASNIPWDKAKSEPEPKEDQWTGCLCWQTCDWNGWHNYEWHVNMPFFCFHLTVVDEEKTWEEALEHCREKHEDLTSLVSETESLLALSEIEPHHTTDRVWIGLRYLGDRWLWVNGDPLEYEAWHKRADQDHQCPMWNRCGALNKEGLWENRDCQEKLNFICY